MREFFIFTAADETCTVKEEGFETTQAFSDILEALAYVRRQRGGEAVKVTSLGPTGEVIFTDTISP